jgi:two-component sensor histidine kinase
VHHRVKNNLQVIASMIHLKARQAPAGSQPHFASLAERIYALGKIYEQVHKSHDLSEIDIGQSLREIAQSVQTDRIHVEASAPALSIGVDTAIPLALIAIELAANAAKHAFPERGGTIRVELRRLDERRAELRIADDGVGFAEEAVSVSSSGLQIVRALVKQIEGELETRSGSGTEHCIRFRSD